MKTTNMPGFTAEASLYDSKRRYLPNYSGNAPGIMTDTVTAARRLGGGQCCVRCGWGDDWCCEECLM